VARELRAEQKDLRRVVAPQQERRLHLVVAQDAAIEKVAASLHDTYKVDYIAPGHCTGVPTFAALQRPRAMTSRTMTRRTAFS
jgi:metal-dependent hydrolase (beta-lactamase superfamily II)